MLPDPLYIFLTNVGLQIRKNFVMERRLRKTSKVLHTQRTVVRIAFLESIIKSGNLFTNVNESKKISYICVRVSLRCKFNFRHGKEAPTWRWRLRGGSNFGQIDPILVCDFIMYSRAKGNDNSYILQKSMYCSIYE